MRVQLQIRKYLVLATVALSLLFLSASEISACSCFEGIGQTVKQRVRNQKKSATAVFAGEVVEIRYSEKDEKGESPVLYAKIKVEKAWKGINSNHVVIATSNFCCVCGFPFKMGERYLVFARELPAVGLATGICYGNRIYDSNSSELKHLGKTSFVNSSVLTTK